MALEKVTTKECIFVRVQRLLDRLILLEVTSALWSADVDSCAVEGENMARCRPSSVHEHLHIFVVIVVS